jgi:hypothetical protein
VTTPFDFSASTKIEGMRLHPDAAGGKLPSGMTTPFDFSANTKIEGMRRSPDAADEEFPSGVTTPFDSRCQHQDRKDAAARGRCGRDASEMVAPPEQRQYLSTRPPRMSRQFCPETLTLSSSVSATMIMVHATLGVRPPA